MSLITTLDKKQFPPTWELVKIGDVLEGSQYGTSNAPDKDGNLPIVGMKDIQDGRISTHDLSISNLTDIEIKKYLLNKGDLLLNRTNSYDLVGKVGLYDSDKRAGFASYLVRLILKKDKIDSVFLNYWLNSYWGQVLIKKIATRAVAQANVNPTEFKKFCLVPLPSLSEQRAIADLLSTWDEAIEKNKRLIMMKEKKFKWLLELFTSEGFLNKNKIEYRKVNLGELGRIKKGHGITKKDLIDSGFPCIRYADIYTKYAFSVENINYYVNRVAFEEALSIESGDILFAASGETQEDIGKCIAYIGSGKACIGGDSLVLNKFEVSCDSLFLGFALNNKKVSRQKRSYASGNPVVHLYARDLAKINIFIPSLSEQKRIADILSTAQGEIEVLCKLSEKYEEQKRGLMQKLLTGKWRIFK